MLLLRNSLLSRRASKLAPSAALLALALASACSSQKSSPSTTPGGGGTPAPGASDPGATDTPPAPTENGGGSSSSSSGGDPGDPPPVPYKAYDINHVISTGQSNSVAHEGKPVLSTTQPFTNIMFNVGVMTSGLCDHDGCKTYEKPSGFVPLVEGDTFWYPVETMSSGLGNEVSKIATTKLGLPKHDVLVSLAGRNGLTYWCLRHGGCDFIAPGYLNPFDENMNQVRDAKALADAQGKTYVVRAATSIHGESDDFAYATNSQEFPLPGTDGTPDAVKSYADALLEWQRDYEKGVKEITGQSEPVPLFVSQFSSWNDIDTSAVAPMQYEAHVRSEGKVRIVTPTYILPFADDCRHFTGHGERQLGEYFAKAYARTIIEGKRWEPVNPKKVTHAGAVITAQFHVPTPPLVFDTDFVVDPGNYGFEVADAAGAPLPIASVALTGPDTVTVTLAQPPSGPIRLRYAFRHPAHTCAGRFVGARGNLRDSDKTPSQGGYDLYNWSVHFDVPVE